MIYLFFIVPFVLGLIAVFRPFTIQVQIGMDTHQWELLPCLRAAKEENEYSLAIGVLCFSLYFVIPITKEEPNTNDDNPWKFS